MVQSIQEKRQYTALLDCPHDVLLLNVRNVYFCRECGGEVSFRCVRIAVPGQVLQEDDKITFCEGEKSL
jgi:hypothetical protein